MLKYRVVTILAIVLSVFILFTDQLANVVILGVWLVYSLIVFWGVKDIGLNFFIRSINSFKSKDKEVIISFDDGPRQATSEILDILKEYNVKASFFLIGENILKYPELLKRIHSEGHTIGNHSYYHRIKFPLQSPKKIKTEITQTNKLIKSLIQKDVKFFRPPFGVTNPFVYYALKKTGMKSVGWNVRSLDTTKRDREKILNKVINKLKGGDIILFHDASDQMPNLLRALLKYLNDNNYKIVNLNDVKK